MLKKGNRDKFDSIEEFVDNLERGGEVEFIYNKKNYSITRPNGLICFMEVGNEASEVIFNKVNELLEYKIENQKIRDIITCIEPYFRCF